MQLCGAPGSRGVPIPHPFGWVGGGGRGGGGDETDPRDTPTRAEKRLKWGVVCSRWGCGGGNWDKGQRAPQGEGLGSQRA